MNLDDVEECFQENETCRGMVRKNNNNLINNKVYISKRIIKCLLINKTIITGFNYCEKVLNEQLNY